MVWVAIAIAKEALRTSAYRLVFIVNIPAVQAVLAAEANGMLHLVEGDFCNGTVDVAILGTEIESFEDGPTKVIVFRKQIGSP